MNGDGKIYIIVTDKPQGGVTPMQTTTGSGSGTRKDKDGKDLFTHWAMDKILNTAKQVATSSIMYSINNIGNFTGNYQRQATIQESVAVVRGMMSVGLAGLAGLQVGGPVGAVIGASMALINKTVSYAQDEYSRYIQQKKTDYAIAQLRDRSGLNRYTDGSRGTEN